MCWCHETGLNLEKQNSKEHLFVLAISSVARNVLNLDQTSAGFYHMTHLFLFKKPSLI